MPTVYQFLGARPTDDFTPHPSLIATGPTIVAPTTVPAAARSNDQQPTPVAGPVPASTAELLATTLDIQLALASQPTVLSAGLVFVNQFRLAVAAEQVAFVRHERSRTKIVAVSDTDEFDSASESGRAITAVGRASRSSRTTVACCDGAPLEFADQPDDALAPDRADGIRPLADYGRATGCDGALYVPLLDSRREIYGGLLVALRRERLTNPAHRQLIERMATLLGIQMGLVVDARRGLGERIVRDGRSWAASRRGRLAAIVAGLVLALLVVPWPYRVAARSQLQLVERRFIAAPFDGILAETFVASGDVVAANQRLAQLDDRLLEIELASRTAEMTSQQKRRDAALARGDVAESQIADHEVQRLTAEIELVQSRLANLEIRSPIDGVIVSGDLDKAEGAPVETGQQLFEVGPLDQMVVEVSIPETDIARVEIGDRIALRLDAYPTRRWTGAIERIHPRSEIIDDASVFVAEVHLDNPDGLLRPGMKGRARISTGWRPLGWKLFHRPLESAATWLPW